MGFFKIIKILVGAGMKSGEKMLPPQVYHQSLKSWGDEKQLYSIKPI